ncbi:MAG: TIGR01458 family HAD-type hydrolase [Leptolyngbya sp. SIO1E4]|nr:TIGR01458 family HAD-type hydrolase [Leptolyngbya sp. SIO1E4]
MLPDALTDVKGLLLDLNGVFYVAHRTLPGTMEAIAAIQKSGLPYRYATNNTTQSTQTMSQSLKAMDLPIEPSEIISAAYAAVLHLRKMGTPTIYPLLTEDAQQDFAEFPMSETQADVIVLGDMGDAWDYRLMNRAFRLMMQGARLIALHRGKFWQWEAGLQLDIGAFVAGLEYATDQQAIVAGKPNSFFFQNAIADLELPAAQIAMIGDDIEADVAGAQAVGMKGILVKSGKYRPHLVEQLAVKPDAEITGVAEIADWFR